ncbi:hypothetical protein Poli38472_008599 [Pythium oligandrum]|uniref:Uncharacterized protein n=1 Tax=Pythium oligandrum TaxID=41045 RepID=A0A8K1FBB9_PYTOL|nr:hypothetical protein Poli38472_008599 [Pythium oligandrum]|eukprot:TMW55951.1 hypothetical protein Poli38472_008599 [Pythium oligandrum]
MLPSLGTRVLAPAAAFNMATNELAAILARRRAKDGSPDGIPAVDSNAATSASAATPATPAEATPAPSAPRSSIAERIARLKEQSAAANGGAPPPMPIPIAMNHSTYSAPSPVNATSEPDSQAGPASPTESSTSADDAAGGNRRTSGRIQQLQGSLGINVNPFRTGGPPGGFRKTGSAGGGGNSIMTTGDQYAHTHGMGGIPMPGMGAAIPMPGLAKAGIRIPGMAPADASSAEAETASAAASLEASHATMTRATGPKRRGPTRPPPGAVRVPFPGATEPTAVEEPAQSPVEAPSASLSTPEPAAGVLFEAPPAATLMQAEPVTPAPLFGYAAPEPAPAAVQPPSFDSTPSEPVSLAGLSLNDPPQQSAATSLFGDAPTTPSAVPTQAPAPVPAPVPAPQNAAPPQAKPSSTLFGPNAGGDESSDSDWSDDDAPKGSSQGTLYGAANPPPVFSAPTPTSVASSSSVTSAGSTGNLFGASSSSNEADSLFGAPTPAPAPTPVPAPAPTPAPAPVARVPSGSDSLFGPPPTAPAGAVPVVRPPEQYTSLFGGDDDSDDSDSDDEGGLFGTGLPTSR